VQGFLIRKSLGCPKFVPQRKDECKPRQSASKQYTTCDSEGKSTEKAGKLIPRPFVALQNKDGKENEKQIRRRSIVEAKLKLS